LLAEKVNKGLSFTIFSILPLEERHVNSQWLATLRVALTRAEPLASDELMYLDLMASGDDAVVRAKFEKEFPNASNATPDELDAYFRVRLAVPLPKVKRLGSRLADLSPLCRPKRWRRSRKRNRGYFQHTVESGLEKPRASTDVCGGCPERRTLLRRKEWIRRPTV